jgi:hypothetical protein
MLACTYCTGFHAGYITWMVVLLGQAFLDPTVLSQTSWMDGIVFSFASAGFSYIVDTAARCLESHSDPVDEEEE